MRSSKVLYGLKGHRYLDTTLYPCNGCKRYFAGYSPDSMKIDMHLFIGFFNFHFSGRFAIDEELHSFITACYDIPTAKIHSILKQMTVDMYMNDYMFYLYAVLSKKIKRSRPDVAANDRQHRTLDSSLEELPAPRQLSALQRTVRVLNIKLQSRKLSLQASISKANKNVSLSSLR
jgi:hypothetical protein